MQAISTTSFWRFYCETWVIFVDCCIGYIRFEHAFPTELKASTAHLPSYTERLKTPP